MYNSLKTMVAAVSTPAKLYDDYTLARCLSFCSSKFFAKSCRNEDEEEEKRRVVLPAATNRIGCCVLSLVRLKREEGEKKKNRRRKDFEERNKKFRTHAMQRHLEES
jgi:hypothetical protein